MTMDTNKDVNLTGEARKTYMETVAKKSVNLTEDERKAFLNALMRESVQATETKPNRVYSQRGDDYLIEAQRVCAEDRPKPPVVCPYCGHKMVHQYVYGDHFFRCPKCRAVAPDKDTEAEAYEAAMQRWQEPNRVLTLEEVQCLAYVEYDRHHVLSVEYRAIIKGAENVFRPCVIAHDRMRMVEIWEIYDGARMTLMEKSMYGKSWRCWLRKPTQEEMEDTSWETK